MAFDFAYYLALWRLGKLAPERVPDIATEALVSGLDSSALRQLAGMIRPVYSDVEPLLERAAAEMGVFPLAEQELAERFRDDWLQNAIPVARQIALRMVSGELDIPEGWLSLPYRDGELGPIAIFFKREVPDSSVVFDKAFRTRILAASEIFINTVLQS